MPGLFNNDDGPYLPPVQNASTGPKERPQLPKLPATMSVPTLPTNMNRLHRRILADIRQERAARPVNRRTR